MDKTFTLANLPVVLRQSFNLLRKSDPLILASSTAFFTTFSLAPIIVILLNVLSVIYFSSEEIGQKIYQEIHSLFGSEAARQIETIVNNFQSFNSHWWITIGGSLFLIFVATTLLRIIKLSIHQLWKIKRRPSNKFRYSLQERLTSFGLIVIMGVLFILAILTDTMMAFLRDYLHELFPTLDSTLITIPQLTFSILAITAWFTVLFKALPDVKMGWKVAISGGLLTGILFNLGEFILGQLLKYGNVVTIFDRSASIVLILLFIFYSSMIIYFGAAFTYKYAEAINKPLVPNQYADRFEIKVVGKE